MFLKALVIYGLIFSAYLTKAHFFKQPAANLATYQQINTSYIPNNGNLRNNTPRLSLIKRQNVSPQIRYLDYQYILGYTYSNKFNSVMNIHPEIGIGIGNKKNHFTTGVTGTYRFLKTREPYSYYHLKDTLVTRHFENLAFAYYFHHTFYHENRNEFFCEIAPGFEILYVERTAKTYNQSRAYAVSFHAYGNLGYRKITKNLRYYQLSAAINYNNFSYGHVTNIPAQTYFNIRFTTGFLVRDDWAMKQKTQKK